MRRLFNRFVKDWCTTRHFVAHHFTPPRVVLPRLSRSFRFSRFILQWLVIGVVVAPAILRAQPVMAQDAGTPQATATADDPDSGMLLNLVGSVVGSSTVRLEVSATPTRNAPALHTTWEVGDAQLLDGPATETLGAVNAYGTIQQVRTVTLPGPGAYGLAVSVTYQPTPSAQYGAATMLYAIVDAQGGVSLTRQDPNAVKLRGMTLEVDTHDAASIASNDELNATHDSCVSVSGRVMREDRLNTQGGRQGPVLVPVRNAYIEIREEDIVFDDSYGEDRTNANGEYSFSF